MRARTNLTGAVEGSLVIFDNGYQGKIITVEDARVKVSVPLSSGNGVNLNLWLDSKTGEEFRIIKMRGSEVMAEIKEYCKTAEAFNKASANYSKAMTELLNSVEKKIEVKDYTIDKLDKRKYQVHVLDFYGQWQEIDKTFKSITSANEWCALHLKKI